MKDLVILPTLIKSLFYQGNWNIKNLQGTGFIWLLKDFFKRNNTEIPKDLDPTKIYYFNTNPYLITFILGMLLKETRINGKLGEYHKVYSSALSALGDTFFWHSLRPFAFFISLCFVIIDVIYVPIAYLVIFNLFNIFFRVVGFYYGYAFGFNVINLFNRIKFNKWSQFFDGVSAFMIGIIISYVVKYQSATSPIHVFKSIVLFIIGIIISRWIRGPIELILATTVLSILILLGV